MRKTRPAASGGRRGHFRGGPLGPAPPSRRGAPPQGDSGAYPHVLDLHLESKVLGVRAGAACEDAAGADLGSGRQGSRSV